MTDGPSITSGSNGDLIPSTINPILRITKIVSEYYGQDFRTVIEQGNGRRRTNATVKPRWVSAWIARELLSNSSASRIARRLGYADHSTIIHAYGKMVTRMAKDPTFRAEIDELTSKCREVVPHA